MAIGDTLISVERPASLDTRLSRLSFYLLVLVPGDTIKGQVPRQIFGLSSPFSNILHTEYKLLTVMSDFESSLTSYKQNETVKNEVDSLQPTASCGEAGVGEVEESRNGQFHRSFSPRQVHVRILWRVLDSPSV